MNNRNWFLPPKARAAREAQLRQEELARAAREMKKAEETATPPPKDDGGESDA